LPETFKSTEEVESALKIAEPRNRLDGATIAGRDFGDLSC
jgi:hypothetical protein